MGASGSNSPSIRSSRISRSWKYFWTGLDHLRFTAVKHLRGPEFRAGTHPVPDPPLQPRRDMDKARQIVAGLGGVDNIVEIEPCITRLRTEVQDGRLVDESALRKAG